MTDPLPSNWAEASLVDVVDPSRPITYGIVQPGPRQEEGVGIPIIRGQDYANGVARSHSLYWVAPEIAAGYKRSVVRPGDLLLSIVGVYVGTIGEVPAALDGANITQTTARLAIRGDLNSRFIFHQLVSPVFQREVSRFTKGSAQPGLNLSDVERMRVVVPPPPEQRRIAEILDTIDETIQATLCVIAKRRQMRTALIRELVLPRRGPGAESALPAGWVDVRIREALQQHVEPVRIDDHKTYDLISIRRRHGGMFHRESLPGLKILGKNMQRVVPGTFVIARRQIVHGACALATPDFDESVMSMSYSAFVGTQICDVRYFFVLAQTPPMVRRFWDASHGVVVEKLNFQQEEWLDYRVQLPPIAAQREVIAAVNASDVEIAALERELEVLRGTRIGLSSDLLSGRVRTVAT